MNLKQIYEQGDMEAYMRFMDIRFRDGFRCPKCHGGDIRAIEGRGVFRCRICCHQFSFLSSSMLSGSKLSAVTLLAAVFVFCANSKGVSSVQMSKLVGITQKSAWVLMHKFREVISAEADTVILSGVVEIDGAMFGGHKILENRLRDGRVARFHKRNLAQRRIYVVAREPNGRTLVFSGSSEAESVKHLRRVIAPGAVIVADGAHAWDGLNKVYDMLRVNHVYAFSQNGATTNWAESFWSVLRKAHRGTYHHWSRSNADAYAREIAWRQDFRKLSVEEQTNWLLRRLLSSPKSEKWTGIWQRHAA